MATSTATRPTASAREGGREGGREGNCNRLRRLRNEDTYGISME